MFIEFGMIPTPRLNAQIESIMNNIAHYFTFNFGKFNYFRLFYAAIGTGINYGLSNSC